MAGNVGTNRMEISGRLSNGNAHRGQPVLLGGRRLEEASAAMVLVHGRGGRPEEMLQLASRLDHDAYAYLAPQAWSGTWYPRSFLAEIEENEPGLSSAVECLRAVLLEVEERGIPAERTIVLGFSQGACLTAEFALRNVRRYGGLVCLTGGYVGPPALIRSEAGSFRGTPVFLGSGDPDPHVPWARVQATAEIFRRLRAEVTLRRYPGLPHSVNRDELDRVRHSMERLVSGSENRQNGV